MLKNLVNLGKPTQDLFKSISAWPEIHFSQEDKQELIKLGFLDEINDSTLLKKKGVNNVYFPSQYILFAIAIKGFALALKEYFNIFDQIKIGRSQNDIARCIRGQDITIPQVDELDDYSKSLFYLPFIDEENRFGAKDIINGSAPRQTLRAVNDFFGSIVLKIINVPDASSDILGDFIYSLTSFPDVYSYFEKKYLHLLPKICFSTERNTFVKLVMEFLVQYDNLEKIQDLIQQNSDTKFFSIVDDDLKLTSIFRYSNSLLSESDVTTGGFVRYYVDPIHRLDDGTYVYLSTQWTSDTGSRLDLVVFKQIIEGKYPELNISIGEEYILRSSSSIIHTEQTPFSFQSFINDVERTKLCLSPNLLIRFVACLATKPFLILTGLSGSGKTKLAQAFASWICESDKQICIIPVGPDWANRDQLLGYPNALQPGEYITQNDVLELIINATNDTGRPYFLILDEMNLSHVERYFADFLSAMESDKSISLHSGGTEWNNCPIPSNIDLPKNLFIIGTVNIDETTYMFSPKVLDRAGVIEFGVTQDEMSSFLEHPSKADIKILNFLGSRMAEDFVRIANREIEVRNDEIISKNLIDCFIELKKNGAEFGYRTASDIYRFAGVVNQFLPETGKWTTDQIIDAAIIQKLLPKLHGSRKKLDPVLKTMAKICLIEERQDDSFIENILRNGSFMMEDVCFPLSLEKIIRMYRRLIQDGFTSFAEA